MAKRFMVDLDAPKKSKKDESCRRKFGRRFQESLHSDLGIVVDLSAGGMRLITGRVPTSSEVEVCLLSLEGEVVVKAKIAWKKRKGFSRHEIGLEFIEVDEETKRMLTLVSSAHRVLPADAA